MTGFRNFPSPIRDFPPSLSLTVRYLMLSYSISPQSTNLDPSFVPVQIRRLAMRRRQSSVLCPRSHTPEAPSCSSPESPCPSSCDEMPRVAFLPEEGRGTNTESTIYFEIQMINVSVLVYSPLEHRNIYRKILALA